MGSVLFWLLVVVCVVALVLLFFPFRFNAEFDLGERGALVRLFLFKKLLWTYEKAWKEKSKKEDEPEDDFGDAAPSFVDTASVRESAPVAPMRAPAPQETANPQETLQPQETASQPERSAAASKNSQILRTDRNSSACLPVWSRPGARFPHQVRGLLCRRNPCGLQDHGLRSRA